MTGHGGEELVGLLFGILLRKTTHSEHSYVRVGCCSALSMWFGNLKAMIDEQPAVSVTLY